MAPRPIKKRAAKKKDINYNESSSDSDYLPPEELTLSKPKLAARPDSRRRTATVDLTSDYEGDDEDTEDSNAAPDKYRRRSPPPSTTPNDDDSIVLSSDTDDSSDSIILEGTFRFSIKTVKRSRVEVKKKKKKSRGKKDKTKEENDKEFIVIDDDDDEETEDLD